ncbi:MAG: hypothetical protein SPJ75_00970 [Candidatus Onthomorpha sp.]|nr:hypothetical protein [Bacteroidales bacterium]MDD7591250.1 hypothetical protein [Bacteroidales bacterium]MDY5825061.1 hypothetical protein [Candidatus Onthomorpha sp.]
MRKISRRVLWLIAMLVLTSSAFAQRIAILNFNAGSGVTQVEVDGLSSIFNTYFTPKGAEIVERTSIDKILQEQKFQNSRFTNTDMVALGELLNVSLIVVGDVNFIKEQYNIDVRVVNVQTGTIVAKDGALWSKGGNYRDMMRVLGERLSKSLELEIEKFQTTSDKKSNDNNGKESVLPKNMTTKITEDNSKRERTDVVVLEGFLKLYPEDLGEFSREPNQLIKQINQQKRYGYNSWRLPTQEELDLIRSNGYLSGNKYMTKEDPSGVLMLVTTKKQKVHYPIAKQEISIHAGIGIGNFEHLGLSAGIKYKYKPFEKYNIRLLGEIGSEFILFYNSYRTYHAPVSVLPILVGVNYEHKFNQNWSVFADIGLGPNIPLSESDYIGFTLSPEIGFAYNKFLFSIKSSLSGSADRASFYHLFRLGYRF